MMNGENKMVISKLKPGMTVYRVKKATGLSKFNGKWDVWYMYIKEVDEENERVLAYGYGGEMWHYKSEWSKWRLKPPVKY